MAAGLTGTALFALGHGIIQCHSSNITGVTTGIEIFLRYATGFELRGLLVMVNLPFFVLYIIWMGLS
jgi:uncharacterized membrane-anchored protein YitT (DUF2179 family)